MRLRATTALVRNLMAVRGFSVRELADKAGTTKSKISDLITGKTVNCTPVVASGLEAALGVQAGLLFVEVLTALPTSVPDVAEVA